MQTLKISNPYLDEYKKIKENKDGLAESISRWDFCLKYAFAIPDDEALKCIAKYSPILEIGAGSGYWASLLKQMNVDIIAVDDYSWITEAKHSRNFTNNYTEVLKGSSEKVLEHPTRNLFLCWSPYDDPLAWNCLRNFKGEFIISIDEGRRGCVANKDYFDLLDKDYEEVEKVTLTSWRSVWDDLTVYRRINYGK